MRLTAGEFDREWLKLLALEAITPADMPTKWIRNWTDRGFLTLSEQNPGIRRPRLYSLRAAVQATMLYHLSLCANPLPFARKVARVAEGRALDLITGQAPTNLPAVAAHAALATREAWEEFAWDDNKPVFLYAVAMDGSINGAFVDPGRLSDAARGVWRAAGVVGMEKRFFPIDDILAWQMLKYFDAIEAGTLVGANARQR